MKIVKAEAFSGRWMLGAEVLREVLEALHRDGLIAYPTETLYALGVNPFHAAAVAALCEAKGRPRDQPVSIAVATMAEFRRVAEMTPLALRLVEAFLPGPLTIVLRATPRAPPAAVSAEGCIGVRMPDHGAALALLAAAGPLTATSANLHGGAPPVTVEDAHRQLGGKVAVYIDAGPGQYGKESTVVDATGAEPRVLREGALPTERLLRYGP